jgi:hypothetical protein
MKKTNLFLPGIAFIIFIGIFIFLVSNNLEDSEWVGGTLIEPGENYVVKEIDGETILENENVGLSLKVPDGWDIEKKDVGVDEWIVNLLSPDATLNDMGILDKGCGTSILVKHDEYAVSGIEAAIQNIDFEDSESNIKHEIIEVSGKMGFKTTYKNFNNGYPIIVEIPVGDIIYGIETLIIEDTDCLNIFNEIMEGVVIN